MTESHRTLETDLEAVAAQNFERKFRELVDSCERDTAVSSSVRDMVHHPAYRKIARLGSGAVPLLLAQLHSSPNWWFEALEDLTEENPARDATGFDEAREAWLRWGRERGHIR
jgi:hypothetical protein